MASDPVVDERGKRSSRIFICDFERGINWVTNFPESPPSPQLEYPPTMTSERMNRRELTVREALERAPVGSGPMVMGPLRPTPVPTIETKWQGYSGGQTTPSLESYAALYDEAGKTRTGRPYGASWPFRAAKRGSESATCPLCLVINTHLGINAEGKAKAVLNGDLQSEIEQGQQMPKKNRRNCRGRRGGRNNKKASEDVGDDVLKITLPPITSFRTRSPLSNDVINREEVETEEIDMLDEESSIDFEL
ncbi:hypothetical protein M422DRAFT_254330 [Sphaerobolus stellatus SS14]|uniref:Uncharacterized protein n=1 Tax=Sphaerobolus stellatus (strain SS14) TaxID=990650 RepID=A0A0C9V6E8_SPHS4|nr:hypothetical protein M422DRAFT_254330 [Sphaerobolus stellatus SS14]